MSTNYIAPIWRMPRNANKDKLSNYSINMANANERITLTDGVDLGINSTVSLWVNFSTNNNSVILADDVNPSSSGYFLLLNTSTGDTYVRIGPNFGGSPFNTSWNLNQWYNIIIVRQGGTVELFKDNVSLGTRSGYGTSNTTKFDCIGAKNAGTFPLYGQISQVVGFDYALSTDQRNYIYNLNNPMVITGAEPVAYLPLGDNSNPNAPGSFPNISVGADSVFDFDTSGAWIDCGNNPILNIGTGDLSISAWVYPTSVSGNDDVIGIGANGGTRIRLQRRADRIGAYIDSSAGQSSMDGTTSLSINQWYHFVLVKAGANFNLYLNGSEVSEASYSNAGSFTDIEVAIGQYFGGFGNKWAGELTNIQIWNSALTTTSPNSDLEKLYNNGQPLMTGTQPQEVNLQAWYKLNQSANWEADTTGSWQIPDAVSAYPQSFKFNETQDYIQGDLNLDGEKVHAVSFWVKNKQVSGLGYVVTNRVSSYAPGFSFIINQSGSNNGYIFSNVRTSPTTTQSVATNYISQLRIPNDDQWHHVAWTQDTVTYKLKAYIDGVFVYEQLPTARTDSNNIANLKISSNVSTQDFGGYISNVMVWEDVVLTDGGVALNDVAGGEIAQVYNNGVPITSASVQSDKLKGWYKLDNTEIWENVAEQWRVKNNEITNVYYNRAGQSNLAYGGAWFNYLTTTNLTQSRTISLWIKYDINRQTGTIRTGFFNNPSLVFWSTGFREINQASSGIVGFTATGVNLSDGGWHHILLHTRGDSTATDNIAYIDGKLATRTVTGTNSFTFGNPGVGYANRQGNLPPAAYSFSNVVMYSGDATSNVNTLYNNGTPPEDVSSTNPDVWWKVNSTNSSVTTIEDFSGNNNDGVSTYTQPVNMVTDEWIAESATSSGMTEQNLVNNNVSVLNGESSGMTTANLVTSNISRTQPYSNYSFNFDAASTDYFDLGGLQGTALQPSNTTLVSDGFSVSVWVNVDDTSSPRTFWQNDGLGSANYYGLIFLMNTGGQLNIGYNNGGTAGSGSRKNYITTAAQITSTGTWYHVVAIYKGIAVTPGLYVNGVEITAFNTPTGSATTLAYSPSAKGSIGVGRNGIQSMEGKISNCACFDRTLTQDEVLNIYNNGVPQDLQTASSFSNNIVAWWPMDGSNSYYYGTNWVVRDIENGNDGTGVNTGNVDDLVGNAPGSDANGSGVNLAIADLIGDMYDSKLNAYSINMADYADGVTNPANSGRSTEVPSV